MKYKRVDSDVFECEVGDDVALLNSRTNTYFLLNPTGAVVWGALAEISSVSDLCETLLEKFEVTKDDCERDVLALISDLTRKGLVVSSAEVVS